MKEEFKLSSENHPELDFLAVFLGHGKRSGGVEFSVPSSQNKL
jgi:hypothetical protein